MKGLLIKDFTLLKNRGIFFLIVIVGYTVFQLGKFNNETAIGFATLMIALFSLTTITYDEYENGMSFLFTLPIRRIDYVREKYVFGFLIATVTWVIMGIACFLFDTFIWTDGGGNFLDKMAFSLTYLMIAYFLISFQIALKLRFAERSSIVTIIIAAIIGVFWSIAYIEMEYGASFMELDLSWNTVAVIGVLVVFALMYGFYRWSVRIMEKREF